MHKTFLKILYSAHYEIEIGKNEKNVRKMVEVIHNTMMRNEHERRSISIEKQSKSSS